MFYYAECLDTTSEKDLNTVSVAEADLQPEII